MPEPLDRAAIRAALEAADPGPWDCYRPHPHYGTWIVERVAPAGHLDPNGGTIACEDVHAEENAHLITLALNSLPGLLDELAALEHELSMALGDRDLANQRAKRAEAETASIRSTIHPGRNRCCDWLTDPTNRESEQQ